MVNPKTTSKSKNTRDMTFSESNKIDNKQIQYYSRQLYYQSYNKTELTTSTFDTTTDITLTESNTTIGIIQVVNPTTE